MSMACGQGSTIKGIPDNVRDYIQLVGNRADVKFDTLSRKKIPQELYDNEELTPMLETVDMSNNVIKKIPAGLGKISKLKKLKLPGNEIAKVPRTVGKLKDLNECDMSRNKIKSIPPTITKANKLERMILKHNSLKKLPPKIGQVGRQLELLDVSNNQLRKLPKSIYTLRGEVNASDNIIVELPPVAATKKSKPTIESLILQNNNITELPESFERLMYLLKLDVGNNQITQIPHTLINMPYLSVLNLANNQIWELPEDFGRLAYSLTTINVANNKLDKLPASIGNLTRCTEMNFANNKIYELPVTMSGCRRLETLNVSNNQIQFCDVLKEMSFLLWLDMSSNSIENFPEADLANLEYLDLSRNKLDTMPEKLKAMKMLKRFHMAHNGVTRLLDELGEGQLIEEIDLSYNNLEGDITFDFQKIRMIQKLNLAHNEIKSLNPTIIKMEYLRELNLSHNKFVTLQRLPKTIRKLDVSSNDWKLDEPHYESHRNTYLLAIMADLTTLTHLSMASCGLEEVPKVVQAYLDLKEVNMSENAIAEVNGSIFNQFRYVSRLDLSKNKLESMPKQVRSLQHLLHLDLSENKLTSFTTDLTILRALRFLNLSKNEINVMPDDFGEMVSLRELNLSHNQIECLPCKKVDVLSSLRELSASNNRISAIPLEYEHLRIQHIDVSFNRIRDLPGLRNFKTVRTLNLSDNIIETVPESVEKMSMLKRLDVSGNCVRFWPKCMAGMSNVEILRDNQRSKDG